MNTYIVMLDGSICWEPTEDDLECWREEMRDLACDPSEWD